jgi:hypothetical protein
MKRKKSENAANARTPARSPGVVSCYAIVTGDRERRPEEAFFCRIFQHNLMGGGTTACLRGAASHTTKLIIQQIF